LAPLHQQPTRATGETGSTRRGRASTATRESPERVQIFFAPLKPNPDSLIFMSPPQGGFRAPDGLGIRDGHRSCPVPLVTILLRGGFGYAQLRLFTALAFDHRLRPPFR